MVSAADILNASILIVDDQDANVMLLDRMLRGVGYLSIESTTVPTEVCELHKRNHYDLIILDLQMPVMDGFQVMEELKEIEEDGYLPVLVITAQPDHKVRALKAGAKDFVSKPFDFTEVLLRVHNMLEVRLLHGKAKIHAVALQQKVEEVEANRDLIQRQSDEVKELYDKIVAEQERSHVLSLQPGAMVGVEKEERVGTRLLKSLKFRHPWLQINLLTAFTAAAVVGMFHETLGRLLILTMFLPVLADQAANTGGQTLAITLRGIILGDLKKNKESALIRKEAMLGLINGALVGVVAAAGMYVIATMQHSPSAFALAMVVFLAMIGSCLVSGVCGAIVPMALKRFGADPVTASTIFVTTVTNVVSIGMLLALAELMVE